MISLNILMVSMLTFVVSRCKSEVCFDPLFSLSTETGREMHNGQPHLGQSEIDQITITDC